MSEPPDRSRRLVISFDDDDPPAATVSARGLPTVPAEPQTELRIALRPRTPLPIPPPPVRPTAPAPKRWPAPAPPTTARAPLAPPPLSPPPPRVSLDGPTARPGEAAPQAWAEYASWPRRAGALLIDALVITTVTFLLAVIAGAIVGGGTSSSAAGFIAGYVLFWLIYVVVAAVYAPTMLARQGECNGQTLGKQALGIRVRQLDGAPIGVGQAFLREVVMRQLVIGGVGVIVLAPLADVLWPLWHTENRSLHDLGASTIVTRDPV